MTAPGHDVRAQLVFSFPSSKGTVNPSVAADMDSYGGYLDGINRIEPTHRSPEPASPGLLAAGALAAVATTRRRRTQA